MKKVGKREKPRLNCRTWSLNFSGGKLEAKKSGRGGTSCYLPIRFSFLALQRGPSSRVKGLESLRPPRRKSHTCRMGVQLKEVWWIREGKKWGGDIGGAVNQGYEERRIILPRMPLTLVQKNRKEAIKVGKDEIRPRLSVLVRSQKS